MRAERRGALGGGRCVTEHRAGVAGSLGVVCQPGEIGRAVGWLGERRERAAVQLQLPVRRHRLLDGETGELVPEGDASPRT